MTPANIRARLTNEEPASEWTDADLVRACLEGDERAWDALISKYKTLIYSIPARYGAPPEDCADVFQTVCLELFTELPRLRKVGALRAWLISVTAHASLRWKRRGLRRAERERHDLDEESMPSDAALPPDLIAEVEQAQMVRDAVGELAPRCREMIRLLFYHQPPIPYQDVARRLGLATGSIGFIRGRCLERLARSLEKAGF
jgi:RNA polymerase sigma factor (sigma-70 family)